MRGRFGFVALLVGWIGCGGGGTGGTDGFRDPGADLVIDVAGGGDVGETDFRAGPDGAIEDSASPHDGEASETADVPAPGETPDSGMPADEGPGEDPGPEVSEDLPADAPADPFPGDPGDPGLDPGGEGCPREPAPADRPRWIVASLPYGTGGSPSRAWTLLRLDTDGRLAWTGARFEMGRATGGIVAFTPDGRLGIAAQDDGSLGVFTVTDDGAVRVVDGGFRGAFYADQVRIVGNGDRALVLDAEWAESGGGVHQVEIGCDGTLVDRGRWIPARLPRALLRLPGGAFLLAAWFPEGLSAEAGDVHLYDLGDRPRRLGGGQAFPDDAIMGGAAVTADGTLALLGDVSEFSGRDTAIAVMEVQGDALVRRQVITPFEDPVSLVAAPQGGTLLAASGYGDALWVLEQVPGQPEAPIRVRGRLDTPGGKPQLPGSMVILERGPLSGRVLVAEVTGIRQVHLGADGSATDLGVTSLGGGVEGLPGALGIQP